VRRVKSNWLWSGSAGVSVDRWIGESLSGWIGLTATVIGVIFHAQISLPKAAIIMEGGG